MAGLQSRRLFRSTGVLCVLAIGALLVKHFCFPRFPKLEEGVQELDKICSKEFNDCYIVRQHVDRDLTIRRTVESEKFSQNRFILSYVPVELDTFGNTVVNRRTVSASYIAALISFPYVMGSLSIDKPGNVLSIGLGGASFDMFLYTNQPKLSITVVEMDQAMVELAQKWFATVEDGRRRTVIGDGVEFLKRTREGGEKFDVIALDACDNSASVYMCPAEAFYDDELMQNIHDSLSERGIVVINVISWDLRALTRTVKRHFPTCFFAQMSDLNQVIACVKYKVDAEEDLALHVKFGIFLAKFGFDQLLGGVVFKQF